MNIKIKKLLIGLILIISLLIFSVTPIFAIANPTSITLGGTGGVNPKVFRNIFNSGDMLFVSEYNLNYPSNPTETASNAFQLQVISTDGTTILGVIGVPAYAYNIASVYFTPTQVTSLGLATNSAYIIRLTGNPAMFGTLTEGTNVASKTLALGDWNIDGALTSKELLRQFLVAAAGRMGTSLSQTLTTTTSAGITVLNTTGKNYVLISIPSLDSVLPGLFFTSNTASQLGAVAIGNSYSTNSTINLRLGTQIGTAFTGIGTWLGISQGQAAAIWMMLFVLTVMSIVFLNSGNTTGAAVLAIPIMVMGTYVGAIPMALVFTGGLIIVGYMGYLIWLR